VTRLLRPCFALAFALSLSLSVMGCQSHAANVMKLNAQGGNADIEINNEGLQDDAQIVSGRVEYEGDILVAWVTVKNREDDKLQVEYRWRSWDSGGKEMTVGGGDQAWQIKHLNPMEEVEITGRAPKPGATRTEFHLRYYENPNP
jgi:uncharacterized protein YcfL